MVRVRSSRRDSGGFTLIELLVVMIVIGILAAIAIPLFISQRARAADTAAVADVTSIGKQVMAYYVDGQDSLDVNGGDGVPWSVSEQTGTVTLDVGPASPQVALVAASTAINGPQDWCVTVTHPGGRVGTHHYDHATGLGSGPC